MVTSLAWPSSWRWVRLPAKGEASKEVEASRESEERGEDGIEKPGVGGEKREKGGKMGGNESEEEKDFLSRSEETEMLKTEIVKVAGKESDYEKLRQKNEEAKSEEGKEMKDLRKARNQNTVWWAI